MSTHLEYISAKKFNSSFKNMLRDYYIYGFKDREDFSGSLVTYNNDRKRINDFLSDYMKWFEKKKRKSSTSDGKNVTFITCDSQSMPVNPFHRVYRFCGTDRPDYLYNFFHTIAALNSSFQLSEGTETLGLSDAAAARFESKLNVQEKQLIRTVRSMHVGKETEEQLEQFYSDEEKLLGKARDLGLSDEQIGRLRLVVKESVIKLKTSELVKFYVKQDFGAEPNSRTANNRLQRLENTGIVCCDQNGGDYVFSDEQVALIMSAVPDEVMEVLCKEKIKGKFEQSLRHYTLKKPGDRNWYLSGMTLKRFIEAGQTANSQFREHLQYALDFYSKTFLFGEIGTYLLDRLRTKENSPIRIKHEYYMHALNDFNAIDLISAIERNEWCLITYKRDEVEANLLCYPIELRISSINGREYLMYYEPIKKSCTSLRLEFIESIRCYKDHVVKRCLAEYFDDTEISTEIDRNLSKAKFLMEYTWGVSTGKVQEENLGNLDKLFQELSIRIAYDKDSDYYILNRIYRESRIGQIYVNNEEGYIDFNVIASDINEIVPFIRSFYSRIISCVGFDCDGYSIVIDIKDIADQTMHKEKNKLINDNRKKSKWSTDEKLLNTLGEGVKANAHEKLFNEMFSAVYHIFGAILSEICTGVKGYSEKELSSLCKTIMYQFKAECGSDMLWLSFREGKVFADMLKKGGFLIEEYHGGELRYKPKYETASYVDFYADVIPLSEIEIRWLKTIIKDEKIHYFFTEKEIVKMKLAMTEMSMDIKPFPMEAVNYYDRYKFSEKKEWKESTVLLPVLDAISNSHVIKIKYVSSRKNVKSNNYKPVLVEYSKRDNCFKGYFLSCRRKEGLKVYNLAQCVSVESTGKLFDESELKAYIEEYREKQMDKVEIEFDDKLNLADRVLTEFSPWERCCEYDSESGVYHLTVSYQKQDGKELAIRLLSFGANIRLLNSDHRLSVIIQSKLRDQKNRMPMQFVKPVRREKKVGMERC